MRNEKRTTLGSKRRTCVTCALLIGDSSPPLSTKVDTDVMTKALRTSSPFLDPASDQKLDGGNLRPGNEATVYMYQPRLV